MGLFDSVYFMDVPGIDPLLECQTKDFDDMYMRRLEVRGGRLFMEIVEYEVTPDDELPNKHAPVGSILRMEGCIRAKSRRWEDLNFHGILRAGDYEAKFTDGNLVELKEIA